MNTDQMKGNWKQFAGKAKKKWGPLTDMIGRLLKESAINSSVKCRNVMELLAKKQSVRWRTSKELATVHLSDKPCALQGETLIKVLGRSRCLAAALQKAPSTQDLAPHIRTADRAAASANMLTRVAAAKSAIHSSILAPPYYQDPVARPEG